MAALELHRVWKAYPGCPVFEDLDFAIESGSLSGIVGPNGAGKTTLLRTMVGLVRPDRGRVLLCGRALARASAGSIAYFAGETSLPPSVSPRAWARLSKLREPATFDRRPFSRLSRGTRQIVGLRILLNRPRPALLVLDEPWEGLDPDAARWLSDSLLLARAAGVAIVVSSHRLHDLAGMCDEYAFFVGPRLVRLGPSEVAPGRAVSGSDLLSVFDRLRRREASHD